MTNDDPTPHPAKPGAVTPDAVLGAGDQAAGGGTEDLAGALGGLDISSLFAAATEMQQHLAEAQDQAANTEIEGVAGGGAVRITVTGAGDFQSVEIQPSAVDPDDVEMLQDLVLAALHDATRQLQALQDQSLGGGLGGLGDLLGGGGLGDLFGGPAGPEH
jgi:DNA-binding YbaB/EbfC family protein